jgi:glycerophosphoryl diester phosphodiesterase
MPALKRIGHKGADLIAPGNTLESFDAALAAGVDMVEFDVLPERPGSDRLVLAHDYEDAARRTALTLEEGLTHFAQDAWEGIELDVDLKLAGYEHRVIEALRSFGLAERTLISTMEVESLPIVRAAAPEVRLGWSVPKVRRNYLGNAFTKLPALAAAQYGRMALAVRGPREIRAGRIDAIMSHWALVTPRLAREVQAAGGELYVWTVDDPVRIARLGAIGVTGVITNDPRLFAETAWGPASVAHDQRLRRRCPDSGTPTA